MQIRKHGPKQKFIIEGCAAGNSQCQAGYAPRSNREDGNSPFDVGSRSEVFLKLLQVGECHCDVVCVVDERSVQKETATQGSFEWFRAEPTPPATPPRAKMLGKRKSETRLLLPSSDCSSKNATVRRGGSSTIAIPSSTFNQASWTFDPIEHSVLRTLFSFRVWEFISSSKYGLRLSAFSRLDH